MSECVCVCVCVCYGLRWSLADPIRYDTNAEERKKKQHAAESEVEQHEFYVAFTLYFERTQPNVISWQCFDKIEATDMHVPVIDVYVERKKECFARCAYDYYSHFTPPSPSLFFLSPLLTDSFGLDSIMSADKDVLALELLIF